MTNQGVSIGDHFVVVGNRPFTSPQGRGFHYTEMLVRVVELDEYNAGWIAVALLKESGAPATKLGKLPMAGGFSLGGMAGAIEDGRLRPVDKAEVSELTK